MLCLESEDCEHDCAGVDGGEGVAQGDDVDVEHAVLGKVNEQSTTNHFVN